MQKVTVTCRHSTECDEGTVSIITNCTYPHPEATFSYCRCKYGAMKEFTYFEVWRVRSGKVIPQNSPGMPKTRYDDTAEGIPTPSAGCAEYSQVGELRFYEDGAMCGQALSLDKDPAWSQLPGFRFGAHTGNGTTAGGQYAFDGSNGHLHFGMAIRLQAVGGNLDLSTSAAAKTRSLILGLVGPLRRILSRGNVLPVPKLLTITGSHSPPTIASRFR